MTTPYDGKNKYPAAADSKNPRTTGNSGSTLVDGSLEDRALEFIRSNRLDMETLQNDRAKFMRYYMGDKLGNETEGHSQVVMSDVQDTIESIMPSMMRIFYGGQDVLNIRPGGPEDEQKAKLMEQKVNFDVQKGINGFKLIYCFVKDALLNKMGVVKYYWLKEVKYKKKSFKGISHIDLMQLQSNPDFLIDNITSSYLSSIAGSPVKVKGYPESTAFIDVNTMSHDVEGRKVIRISKPIAENLPPEEFIFNVRSRELKECVHKVRIHKNRLKKKYKLTDADIKEAIDEFDTQASNTDLVSERFRDLGGSSFLVDDKDANFCYIYECYLDDYDEEGAEVPKKITIFGTKKVEEEDNSYGKPPFVTMSPILMSHRVCGRSLAELVVEIQKLRTALVRYILDNIYFQNNGMKVVNPYRIDAESLMNANRPGGVAFTKFDIDPSTGIFPVPVNPLPPHVMDFLEYAEGMKENRTGVTRYNQGLDSKSLNRTATGISQIMGAAQQRIELIARIFAETGMKDLYQAFVDMNIDYFDETAALKINQEWKTITPEDIDGTFDVLIDVGIGTGSKEIAFNQKQQMLNIYGMIAKIAGPGAVQIFTIENIKNILKAMWEDQGYKNTSQYVAPDGQGAMNGPGTVGDAAAPGTGGNGTPEEQALAGVLPGNGVGDQGPAMGMPGGGLGPTQGAY